MAHPFPHDALRAGWTLNEAGLTIEEFKEGTRSVGSALSGVVGAARRSGGDTTWSPQGANQQASKLGSMQGPKLGSMQGPKLGSMQPFGLPTPAAPRKRAAPTPAAPPAPRPSYSAVYGLMMSAARAATQQGKGSLASRFAQAAKEVAASARQAGQQMAARVSQLNRRAVKELAASWSQGQAELKAGAARMGAAGSTALRWVGRTVQEYGPGVVTNVSRNLTIGLVAVGVIAAAVVGLAVAVR